MPNVLVIDDNADFFDTVACYLTTNGFHVKSACGGKSGIDKYWEFPDNFDAILMGIQMPVMDGYEAATLLRDAMRKSAQRLRIIGVSGEPRRRAPSDLDCPPCKPFRCEDLLSVLYSCTNCLWSAKRK